MLKISFENYNYIMIDKYYITSIEVNNSKDEIIFKDLRTNKYNLTPIKYFINMLINEYEFQGYLLKNELKFIISLYNYIDNDKLKYEILKLLKHIKEGR